MTAPSSLVLLNCDFDRSSVGSLDRHDNVRTVARLAENRVRQGNEARLVDRSVPDEPPEYGARVHSGELSLRRHAEYAVELVVGENEATVAVDHAQAVRHIVERGVESPGQHGASITLRDLGPEDSLQAVRRRFDEQKDRQQRNNNH
jgi:hypothetical protein